MAITQERLGEIALLIIKRQKLEKEGVTMKPKEIKREVHNAAKRFGVKPQEVAELFKLVLDEAYEKTLTELEAIISDTAMTEGEFDSKLLRR